MLRNSECGRLASTAAVGSPAWHRAERRRRAKARVLLRSQQFQSPYRTMQAARRLVQHHGSQPPWQLHLQTWQRMICGCRNPMAGRECEQCTYPIVYQRLTPQKPGLARAEQRMRIAIGFAVCAKLHLPTELWDNHPNLLQQCMDNVLLQGWLLV